MEDMQVTPAPKTLQEWRSQKLLPVGEKPGCPRDVWTPLESFFLSHGYTLWQPRVLNPSPPNDAPRTPDGFAYRTIYCEIKPKNASLFPMISTIHCPARTTDNRDVLIRLMAIGEDRGERHRMSLSRLATGDNALLGNNHVVPVLQELVNDDMIFAVFPLLSWGFDYPWFYRFSEVLDIVEQVLEGINFCHERLVAHLDLDTDNILINWAGSRCQTPEQINGKLGPFRSLFPIRYYINDFEFAVTFEADSEPSSRTVTGLPITGVRTGKYGRDIAPEMLSEAPYCPFRADIWQLGSMFKFTFGHLGHLSQPLVDLIDIMCSDVPSSRPSASEALDCVRRLVHSHDILISDVPPRARRPILCDIQIPMGSTISESRLASC